MILQTSYVFFCVYFIIFCGRFVTFYGLHFIIQDNFDEIAGGLVVVFIVEGAE